MPRRVDRGAVPGAGLAAEAVYLEPPPVLYVYSSRCRQISMHSHGLPAQVMADDSDIVTCSSDSIAVSYTVAGRPAGDSPSLGEKLWLPGRF